MKIMNVRTHTVEGTPVVELSGELDISTAQEVEHEFLRVEADRPAVLVVDLRGLTFIDSTGLRIILATDSRCWRYTILDKCQENDKLDVATIG